LLAQRPGDRVTPSGSDIPGVGVLERRQNSTRRGRALGYLAQRRELSGGASELRDQRRDNGCVRIPFSKTHSGAILFATEVYAAGGGTYASRC
jgi:hypothetical protein